MQEEIIIGNKKFRLMIPEKEIEKRISELATRINEDYKDKNPLFIAILSGSFIFASDLFKEIEVNCGISFVKLASYQGTKSTGRVKELMGLTEAVNYKDIIILEDIIDTGKTIEMLKVKIREFKPVSLKIAALLYKTNSVISRKQVDYVGFEIPPEFVVGYGLDYMEMGRNLRDIYIESN